MNDYDKVARFGANRLDPLGFLLWLLGVAFDQTWRWLGWLLTQAVPFPGEPDRRCDTVATFARRNDDGPPLAVVVEFMSETRQSILERLVDYGLQVHAELPYRRAEPLVRYQVVGVVVNLSGERLDGHWNMAPPQCGGLGLWSKAGVHNLEARKAKRVLAQIAAGTVARCILVWVPLMEGGADPVNIARWKRLAEGEPDAEKKRWYAALALVFAEKAGCWPVWQKALEGWQVLRSQVTLEWEAAGPLDAMRSSVLTVLQERFPQQVPATLVQAVETQEGRAVLDRWLRTAVRVSSPEAMTAEIAANGH